MIGLYVRVTDLGTLHCPYMRTTSAGSTGLMQKSLKRSQSVHVFPTCAKPSSADRLSTAGVAGKCSPASAAAICPGVKPCVNKTHVASVELPTYTKVKIINSPETPSVRRT